MSIWDDIQQMNHDEEWCIKLIEDYLEEKVLRYNSFSKEGVTVRNVPFFCFPEYISVGPLSAKSVSWQNFADRDGNRFDSPSELADYLLLDSEFTLAPWTAEEALVVPEEEAPIEFPHPDQLTLWEE